MPAEWEPHRATWLSWPHKAESWPGKFELIQPIYAQMVAALAPGETVHINVNNAFMESEARKVLAKAGVTHNIEFHHFPTNDAWCRDHGAIFVVRDRDRQVAVTDWGYNAWGEKYPPYDLDNLIPRRMAEHLKLPRFEGHMILEGGSIEVNGAGVLLTSEACLLNDNRNPHMSRVQIEDRLCDYLGVRKVLWVGDGIVGDDTDGHIDDMTRFVSADTILTSVEEDPEDENYPILQENLQRLKRMTNLDGRPFTVLTMPMPPAVIYEGHRLPASYANYYIGNQVVVVPFFNHPNDERAQAILQRCFPTRRIVGIDCTDIVWGLGAWHCLTQQVPAGTGIREQKEQISDWKLEFGDT
jgi:agmatine deiminase